MDSLQAATLALCKQVYRDRALPQDPLFQVWFAHMVTMCLQHPDFMQGLPHDHDQSLLCWSFGMLRVAAVARVLSIMAKRFAVDTLDTDTLDTTTTADKAMNEAQVKAVMFFQRKLDLPWCHADVGNSDTKNDLPWFFALKYGLGVAPNHADKAQEPNDIYLGLFASVHIYHVCLNVLFAEHPSIEHMYFILKSDAGICQHMAALAGMHLSSLKELWQLPFLNQMRLNQRSVYFYDSKANTVIADVIGYAERQCVFIDSSNYFDCVPLPAILNNLMFTPAFMEKTMLHVQNITSLYINLQQPKLDFMAIVTAISSVVAAPALDCLHLFLVQFQEAFTVAEIPALTLASINVAQAKTLMVAPLATIHSVFTNRQFECRDFFT